MKGGGQTVIIESIWRIIDLSFPGLVHPVRSGEEAVCFARRHGNSCILSTLHVESRA